MCPGGKTRYDAGGSPMQKVSLVVAILVALLAAPARPLARSTAAMPLLERYASGDFDAAVAAMASITDFGPIYKELKAKAPHWIEAGGDADRERRRLAAATFAMEAARIGANTNWKEVRMFMRLENIYWRPPAQLLEWGCQLMRDTPAPTPAEHAWQMAALSVAGHAEDYEFLVGSPWAGRANKKDEILHLEHAIARFPKDRRLLLAQGIAAELRLYPRPLNSGLTEAQRIFENLRDDPEVGAEANMRFGAIAVRAGQFANAVPALSAAIAASHDPFVTYLAYLFTGQVRERQGDPKGAEAAYRSALAAIPRAQSATFSLAAVLAARGARAEAASLVSDAIASQRPVDPWRVYGDGDDRFWETRIADLRREIRR
jgi:tetratricopeptide (TPR) repeat protein